MIKKLKINVDKWLKYFNIPKEIYLKNGRQLSSGQQKKILLIQALVHEPEILILDEPVANLDPKVRAELYEILASLQKNGKTIFVSSHILSELEQYIDSLTVLDQGEVKDTQTLKLVTSKLYKYNYQIKFDSPNDLNNLISLIKTNLIKENKIEFKVNLSDIELNSTKKVLKLIIDKAFEKDIKFISLGENNKNLNQIYFGTINYE